MKVQGLEAEAPKIVTIPKLAEKEAKDWKAISEQLQTN